MSDIEASDVSSSNRNSKPVMNGNHAKHSERKLKTSTRCLTRLLQQWSWHCKMLIVLLEKLFEKFAWFVSKKPFYVILSTLFLAAFLTLGFTQLNPETNVKYLFLPENSQASRDIVRAKQIGFELDVRQEEIILLPKQNETLLSQKCMREMIEIHEKIVQTDQYEKYCFRPNADGNCVSTNLLELFDYNKTKLGNITGRIETALENDLLLMSNGKRLTDNFYSIFGKKSSNISLLSTNALRMVYFMTEHYSGNQRADILKWESAFIETMSIFSKNTTCVDILYSAERSLDDSVTESTGSDIKFFAITFTIMGIFSSVVNGRCADSRYGHQLLGFSALLAIYLGVTSAFGLLMFAGVPFVSMVGVLPFLVVSIGIDDVFIILHELNEVVRKHLPAAHMLSGTMARSGPTITMTTLTDLVAFAVSCRSLFPAVRFFCGYAALALTFAFLMLVTFFVGCMWFDIKRIKAKRRDFLPCFRSPPPRECCSGIRRNALDNVMKAWGRILTGTLGKTLVCLFSVLLLASGIYGALHVDESFSRQLLTTKDSHYRTFLDVYEERFYLDIEIDVIVPGELDYSSYKIQQKYLSLKNVATSNEYLKQGTISWLSEFLKWAKSYSLDTKNTKSFYENLQQFLSLPNYKRFNKDLKFSENRTRITASRIFVYSKSNPDSEFQREMMTSLREYLSRSSDLDVFPVALPFIYFEQYAHVLHETIRNLIISGISILVISSFFLNHPMIILCLLCSFVALIIELLGLMYLWDVSVNSISMIILVMALGFSVDYNAHIAYHFVSSKERSPELRVVDALNSVGGSVFLGGLSTFLGMMTTGFASSFVFKTFFKMFMGIVVLGLLHGLVILPVYLTLLGNVFDLHVPEATFEQLLKVWYSWKKSGENSSDKINPKKILDSNLYRKYSPVAVVGIGCRFPGGAKSKDDFWNMLVEGRCGIDRYPANRPDAREFEDTYNPGKNTPGKHYVLTGAFLDEVSGFDAQFFGISSTECRTMDPQQRLLLHVVYEAIEDAGIRLTDLQQCRTGVYVGLMNLDYGSLIMDTSNIRKLDQFASTGCTSSVAANRISFSLNLTGPSLTVDTACSSSLTALHLAFGHLQTGECDAAIVCAPNILLSGSKFHTACCRSGLLAQDGRCKSFDIKGDGYGRGEGVAAVVLKPTTTAIQDKDDIYAEIIASGLNNDGQSAIPMTSPSAATQATLFQRVLHDSGLSKDDIQYVEAHGTGTAIGDVVEMESISAVYGNSNSRVLRVGSVKSNINHTESTAGIAGLIKTCLMIKNEHLVPTINVHEVKPQLKMSERQMMVQIHNEPWKSECDKPRIAAVCSYGYGGTNANVILQEVTQSPAPIIPSRSYLNRIMTLSATSNDALKAMAKKYSGSIKTKSDDDELLKDNICYSLNERYTLHSHRLAVTFRSFKHAAKALEMFAEEENGWQEVVSAGDATIPCNKVAFLYGGQGGQWYGMARQIITNEPKFKESIEKIDQILKRQGVPWSLTAEFNKSEETSRMNENPIGQTALFAVQFALTELLKSWGVTPSAVVGHSLGEITAACASGALSLTEALKLVLIRSKLHNSCSSTGCMAAVGMSEDDARSMLQQLHLENQVDIAVINSPIDVVLSGDEESIKLVESHVCENREDVFWRTLGTTRAFHSHEMEKLKESFTQQATKLQLRPRHENIPFYSTVTGTKISGKLLSQKHWWKNVRQTVLLSQALNAMFTDDHRTFVEISASPQLSRHVHQTWSRHQKARIESHNDVAVIATLPKRSASDQHKSFLQNCVAHLFTRGFRMSWNRIQGSGSRYFIRRPTYPWQESEFWYRDSYPAKHVSFLGEKIDEKENSMVLNESHPLLGKRVSAKAFSGLHAWESEVDLHRLPYLKDHTFADSPDPIVPGSVYIEIVLAMVLHMFPQGVPDVQNITFNKLLAISSSDSFIIRSRLYMDKSSKSGNRYQITKVQEDENEVVLSEGSVKLDIIGECRAADSPATATYVDLETIKARMVKVPPDYLDKIRKNMGFQFGAQFSLITEAWFNDLEALATICPTEEIRKTSSAYVIHPSIIDACLQSLLLIHSKGKFVVPYRIENVTIFQKITSDPLFSHGKTVQRGEKESYNITLMDCYGRAVMLISGFLGIDLSALHAITSFENAAFKLEWKEDLSTPETRTESSEKKALFILQDNMGYAKQFMEYWPKSENAQLVDMHDTPDEICTAFSESLKETMRKRKITGNREKLLIINFWPVDASQLGAETQNFLLSHRLAFETSLLIVQEILKKEDVVKEIQLVFVTSGVVSMADVSTPDCFTPEEFQPVFPWASSVFGFRRTFSEEINVPKASVIDLPQNPNVTDFQHMVEDLKEAVISEEIAYRNGLRYVNRLVRLKPCDTKFTEHASPINQSGKPKAFKLSFISDNLVLRQINGLKPEVCSTLEVYVARPLLDSHWASLTAHDRVAVAGKLRNESDQDESEDLVVGVCKAGNLGNYVVAKECCCFTTIHDMTAQQAASLCFPMAMSYHLINDILIDVKQKKILVYHTEEETCCIFACVALSLEASIVSLAKDKKGRDRLKHFGIPEVFTEYEMIIGEEVQELKLDAVFFLSKARRSVVQRVMSHLKPGGKIISVFNTEFNILHEKDVNVLMTNLDYVTKNSETFSSLLASCIDVLVSRELFQKLLNIPHVLTSIYDLVKPDSTHVSNQLQMEGKYELRFRSVCLKPKHTPEKVEFYTLAFDSIGLRRDRTYLIVGGIRGFGFEVAKWMVENGARTVMCTARSPPSEEKKIEVQRLEQKTGSRIILRQADVTSWTNMTAIKDELEALPNVAGIVFSAMVLEDQLIKEADLETCKRVISTKVEGSVLLHQLSLTMSLDFFIMFSSISGTLGNVGQVSYAAANTFLDYLCEYRRYKLGLPALSVNWGPISGAGVLERNKDVAVLLEKQGFYSLDTKTAMEFLKRILLKNSNEAQVCLCHMSWPVYLRSHISPRLQLIRDETQSFNVLQNTTTLKELKMQSLESRITYVKGFITGLLASWSEADVTEVDLNVGLYKYGIDSIGAASMAIQIQNGLGVSFETYYFVQPKTSGLTIINDILERTENERNIDEDETNDNNTSSSTAVNGDILDENKKHDDAKIELQTININEKVIPLYVTEDAAVKVFMTHSSHKSAMANAAFARGFEQQALVAFYSVGMDDYTRHHTSDYGTVQTLAKKYLELIKKEQPWGPYYLAGYSFGGTLVYEIASLLVEQDEELAMVFMLDTSPWFPKALAYGRQLFLCKSKMFHQNLKKLVTKQMIQKLAYIHLGVSPTELDEMSAAFSNENELISVLEQKAAEKDVPLHMREEVDALQYQLRGAMEAHDDWQPPKVRYRGPLTYVQCEKTKVFSLFWDGPQMWKSLSGRMDLYIVPGHHVDQKDEIPGKLDGSLMMTTAAMKYRTRYSMFNLLGYRSRVEKRLVDWLKQGVNISMYLKDSATLLKGTFWLDNDETVLTFVSERLGFFKKRKVILKELNNILPGKYVNAIQKSKLQKVYADLIICMITNKGKLYNIRCSDWEERNQLMDSLDALFGIPFVRINN